jgi:hypothetical protein
METKVLMSEQEGTSSKEFFDLRFKNPCSIILGGVSQSGKTTFVFNVLRHIWQLFEEPRCAQNIIYYYSVWQNAFDSATKEGLVKEWHNRLPSMDEFKSKTVPYQNNGGSVVVIDDWAEDLNMDVLKMFTSLCHHHNAVVILLTQNIFSKNKVFHDISINANYVVLFKNPRDQSQITYFARQFAQNRSRDVVQTFYNATKRPYTYLLFDLHMMTPPEIQIRSHILPGEGYPFVYLRPP